jgi:hypothetical protein
MKKNSNQNNEYQIFYIKQLNGVETKTQSQFYKSFEINKNYNKKNIDQS